MKNTAKIGLFDITMIMVSLVIGMGIFGAVSKAANEALNPTIYFLAWLAGGLIAFCGALTFAEIGSRYPATGGFYKVFSYAYHPSVAFGLNCGILISNAASLAGVALIGSNYITQAVLGPETTQWTKLLIAMFAIFIFYGVNMLGLKLSAKAQTVLMLIKIGMLLLVISGLFFPATHAAPSVNIIPNNELSPAAWIKSFGLCLVAVSFSYGGYQQTINFGSEVNNPSRNVPKAIFNGILIILVLYFLVNVAYYKVVGFDNMKSTNAIASDAIAKIFGPEGAKAFSVLLFLSVLAYVNVSLLSNPRVMFAMSEDGVLPKIFQFKNEKRGVIVVSLTVYAAIAIIVLFFADTFERLLTFSIFLDSLGMATAAATIFVLRKKTQHLDGKGIYKMKFFPLLPLIFIIAFAFVCGSIVATSPNIALVGTLVILASVGLYFLIKATKKAAS